MAENASTLASSAARSRLLNAPDPKFPDALMSTSRKIVSSRSSVNFLTNGLAGARRHIPIDGSHFIAGAVFAHLIEIHAPALEYRMV